LQPSLHHEITMVAVVHLSSREGVTSDNTTTGNHSRADVRQILAVQVLAACRWNRMLDKHRVRASLQHGVESVSLGGWTVELRVVVEALSQVIDQPFPRPSAASIVTSRLAVDFDNVTGGSEGSAVGRSIPQSRTERTFAVVVFVHFLYACAVNSSSKLFV